MTPAELPARWRLAVTQLRRGALDSPWSSATWTSVIRRTVVLAGFVGYGLFTGQLDTAIFGAFGALQLGLGEAVLPLRGLVRLIAVQLVVLLVVGFAAASLDGTWWTVPLLTALAFIHGSTISVGLVPRATGIGALAIGVIFAGLPDVEPATAALWLGIGCGLQGAVWLAFWHRERALSVRRGLANTIRSVSRIAVRQRVSGRDSNLVSAEVDQVRALVSEAEVPAAAPALDVTDAVKRTLRTAIAWRVLKQPGVTERMEVAEALRRSVATLDEAVASPQRFAPDSGERWAVKEQLDQDIGALNESIGRLRQARGARGAGTRVVTGGTWSQWRGLRPGSPEFRHGLRLAVAIALGQALSLVIPVSHSFWIPLTVVFVVKPEWSSTVVRSAARVLGNLLAVILVPPALAVAAGNDGATVVIVAVVAAIAFRYFSGNYITASFGVAGTILVLDQTLYPDEFLYEWRIAFTLIGALVGLAVSAAIPTWRGGKAPVLLDDLVTGLGEWSRLACRAVLDPSRLDSDRIRDVGENERNNLIRIRPAVDAALLEPRPVADPRALVAAVDAAERAHMSLLALTFQARLLNSVDEPGLDICEHVPWIQDSLTDAARELGLAPPGSVLGDVERARAPSRPRTPEDLAVVVEAMRLRQAAADLAEAVSWVVRSTRPAVP